MRHGKHRPERLPFSEQTGLLCKRNAEELIYLDFSNTLPLVPYKKLLQNKDYQKSATVG